mmetsp:Transcript_2755/g.5740  ORF Transcript_2755/g.5740 Transcript_2755/m.5740 type:complete len:223 (-) Transcript_2755:32-700(-)
MVLPSNNTDHYDDQPAPSRSSRQASLSKSQACSSRSLVSIESIESIWSLDSYCSDHDENVHESEHSIATITTGRISKETTEGSLSEDLCIELIQETWNKLLQSQKNDKKALGMQLVANMLKIKPSCSTSLGVSSSSERTPRFAELGAKLGDLLDQLVQSMGPDLCDEDLAEEWIEEGLDALLVQKAVIRCLEESLDSDEYSFEAAQAWSTTFKDTLQKVLMF